jgi:hypothetical protein
LQLQLQLQQIALRIRLHPGSCGDFCGSVVAVLISYMRINSHTLLCCMLHLQLTEIEIDIEK